MRIEILSDAEDDLVAGAKFPFAIFIVLSATRS
jgi:hypothetical protein